jgi:hypothetical protein
MNVMRAFRQLGLAAALACSSGCVFLVGAGAGAGAIAYAKGKLNATEAASLNKVWTASLTAVEELDYVVTETNKQSVSAVIIGRNQSDERLEVTMKSITDKSTELGIRAGTIGDEERSRLVLDRIRRHLKD